MTDLAKRWLSWASGLTAWPLLWAPFLLMTGKITPGEWSTVNVVLIPAFLTLKGVETWRTTK